MRSIRFRMNGMMIWVAVIAANLAVLRGLLWTRSIPVVIGGVALGGAIFLATYRALATGGRRRAYWLGFLGGGATASMVLAGGMAIPGSLPGRAVERYMMFTFDRIERSEPWLDAMIGPASELVAVLILGLTAILPVVIGAMAGGPAARLLFDRRASRSGPVGPQAEGGLVPPCPSPR